MCGEENESLLIKHLHRVRSVYVFLFIIVNNGAFVLYGVMKMKIMISYI